jgi:hypothetical protein
MPITAASPRTAFWVGIQIASLSAQLNVLLLSWTWSAIASLSSQEFADTHYLAGRVAALAIRFDGLSG